jgi:single stranded DNA-binding protein (ssb)
MILTIVIGNCGRTPETRTTQSGTTVCSFSLASTERYNGEDHVTWFKVSAFGKLGEVCQKYVDKGKRLLVTGKVSASCWIDKKSGEAKCSLDIIAEKVKFLSAKSDDQRSDADETANRYDEQAPEDDLSDLPF